jgi:hypothetical protein
MDSSGNDTISKDMDADVVRDQAALDASSDLYSAEFIVDKKRGSYRGKKMILYRVRWTGYTEADDTWEPIENLSDGLLLEFEESIKQHRPRQQASSSQVANPLVTWSDMLQMLGSCPPECLPNCLHPPPPAVSEQKVQLLHSDKDQKQRSMKDFFLSQNFCINTAPLNGSNPKSSTSETLLNTRQDGKASLVTNAAAGAQSDRHSCEYRPRLKQVAPSRSPLANVLMNC